MTDRTRRPEGDDDAEADPPRSPLGLALDDYRERFGVPFGCWDFMGFPRELERELRDAIRDGRPVTEAEMYRRLGLTPPPPGVIL